MQFPCGAGALARVYYAGLRSSLALTHDFRPFDCAQGRLWAAFFHRFAATSLKCFVRPLAYSNVKSRMAAASDGELLLVLPDSVLP